MVKTSITIPEVLVRFAESQMENDGFPSLSSYLVHLLHEAKEKDREERVLLAKAAMDLMPPSGKSSSSTSEYRISHPQLNEVHDKPAPKKRKAA